jgi:hypothetical protein
MNTKSYRFRQCSFFGCLLLLALGFGQEAEQPEMDELESHTAQNQVFSQESSRQTVERGLTSVPAAPPTLANDPHDCEAAREAHALDTKVDNTFTEDDAMEQFTASPAGQALMDEFINTVETTSGERVLKIDVAQEFERSLEYLDHTSTSDSL